MLRRIFVAAGLFTAAGLAVAQAAYPTKPITMIVPFPPGGLADIVGRPVAEAMGRDLGQPVVIENKGGAGGGIGMAQVAKAAPDGYTILMALSSYSVNTPGGKPVLPSFLISTDASGWRGCVSG